MTCSERQLWRAGDFREEYSSIRKPHAVRKTVSFIAFRMEGQDVGSYRRFDVMSPDSSASEDLTTPRYSRREELFAFIVLAVLVWPFLAVAIVGGYGFAVWMSQLVLGPPGPPHH